MRSFRTILADRSKRNLWRQIRGQPALYAFNAALEQAKLDDSDEVALGALRAALSNVPAVAVEQAITDWRQRCDYLYDRGYRLLVAVRDGAPVTPMAHAKRAQFEREAELGRMPLDRAFGEIADLEPRLREIESRSIRTMLALGKAVSRVVGPRSGQADPILSSDLALRIAVLYLWKVRHGRAGSPTSLFASSAPVMHGSSGSPRQT